MLRACPPPDQPRRGRPPLRSSIPCPKRTCGHLRMLPSGRSTLSRWVPEPAPRPRQRLGVAVRAKRGGEHRVYLLPNQPR